MMQESHSHQIPMDAQKQKGICDAMNLIDPVRVSANVRRIIGNGFYSHHPFHEFLADFVSILQEIRRLPKKDFCYCLAAVRVMVEGNKDCRGCHGKGMAYFKLLTKGIDELEHRKASDEYTRLKEERETTENWEEEVMDEIDRQGVSLS